MSEIEQKKIQEIRKAFEEAEVKDIPKVCEIFRNDERTGVIKLIEKYDKVYGRYLEELKRMEEMKEYERKYSQYEFIAGIDEVGRGPLAGPVVTCAVILPKDCNILYINDSKKLSEKKREELYEQIMEQAIAVGIGMEEHTVIDDINILQATYSAMRKAIEALKVKPDLLLNDAVRIPGVDIPQVPIIKGDAKSISIAAASIVAKVTRDRMMTEYDKVYPGYDFAGNKGYGAPAHLKALKDIGPSPIHRQSFIKNLI